MDLKWHFEFLCDTAHVNANTTMTLMYKILVIQTKGETTVHFRGVYFFYMNVCYCVSANVPNVLTYMPDLTNH